MRPRGAQALSAKATHQSWGRQEGRDGGDVTAKLGHLCCGASSVQKGTPRHCRHSASLLGPVPLCLFSAVRVSLCRVAGRQWMLMCSWVTLRKEDSACRRPHRPTATQDRLAVWDGAGAGQAQKSTHQGRRRQGGVGVSRSSQEWSGRDVKKDSRRGLRAGAAAEAKVEQEAGWAGGHGSRGVTLGALNASPARHTALCAEQVRAECFSCC